MREKWPTINACELGDLTGNISRSLIHLLCNAFYNERPPFPVLLFEARRGPHRHPLRADPGQPQISAPKLRQIDRSTCTQVRSTVDSLSTRDLGLEEISVISDSRCKRSSTPRYNRF